ncbi:MAG: sensor histidine kinase [Tannerellaceae bacterium]
MNNLSFHITDIASNSLRAGATEVCLDLQISSERISIRISDNGCGMDAETVARACNPFYTTRTTRKIGLGLPFLIQNAEQTGGRVTITSTPGVGTEVCACFVPTNIDCPPWGDLSGTVAMLLTSSPEVNIRFIYHAPGVTFALSTCELKEALDGLPLSHPKVILFVKEMIEEGIR